MEKEQLQKRAEFIKRDMLHTSKSLYFIADQMMGNERENNEWMEYLCYVLIKDRAKHLQERAEELFLELGVEGEKIPGNEPR